MIKEVQLVRLGTNPENRFKIFDPGAAVIGPRLLSCCRGQQIIQMTLYTEFIGVVLRRLFLRGTGGG